MIRPGEAALLCTIEHRNVSGPGTSRRPQSTPSSARFFGAFVWGGLQQSSFVRSVRLQADLSRSG